MSVHRGVPSHLPAYWRSSIVIEVAVATTSSALAEETSSEMRGTRNPSGMNIAKFPPIVWRQKAVVEGCPGLGTKHPIDWSTGTRLIPKDPFAIDIDGGASVSTPSITTYTEKAANAAAWKTLLSSGLRSVPIRQWHQLCL